MRPPLSEQAAFRRALRDARLAPPGCLAGRAGEQPIRRFNVHRNNVHVSLVEAIEAIYPTVSALVGEAFSRAMARAYVADHLPDSPVLLRYGGDYPAFIRAFEPAIRPLPYLADVAAIDWGWHEAYHAPDAPPLGLDTLAGLAPDAVAVARLIPHPATRVARSPWPALGIWRANRDAGTARPERVDAGQGGEETLISRPHLMVTTHRLPPGGAALMDALWQGHRLGDAVASVRRQVAGFDTAACLQTLLSAGALADARIPDTPD